MIDYKKKPRHVRREKPKNEVQFTVKVDADLFNKANRNRKETWVNIAESMLRAVVLKGEL